MCCHYGVSDTFTQEMWPRHPAHYSCKVPDHVQYLQWHPTVHGTTLLHEMEELFSGMQIICRILWQWEPLFHNSIEESGNGPTKCPKAWMAKEQQLHWQVASVFTIHILLWSWQAGRPIQLHAYPDYFEGIGCFFGTYHNTLQLLCPGSYPCTLEIHRMCCNMKWTRFWRKVR